MTISAIPYTIICLAIFGMILIVLGMVVQVVVEADNQMQLDTSLHYSSDRGITMDRLVMCFNAMGLCALMSSGLFLVLNGIQSQSGEI